MKLGAVYIACFMAQRTWKSMEQGLKKKIKQRLDNGCNQANVHIFCR